MKAVRDGSVALYFNEETNEFSSAFIDISKESFIGANKIDTFTLFFCLKSEFENRVTKYILDAMRERGSGWFYLMRLVNNEETFWLSHGPLNAYIPTERMKQVYADLCAAFTKAGGIPSYPELSETSSFAFTKNEE